jgi:hypothetical protein
MTIIKYTYIKEDDEDVTIIGTSLKLVYDPDDDIRPHLIESDGYSNWAEDNELDLLFFAFGHPTLKVIDHVQLFYIIR